jgi:hypothetical protein
MTRRRTARMTLTAVVAFAGAAMLDTAPAAAGGAHAGTDTEALGDFNGDGRADLVVGLPEENVDGAEDAGVVEVSYGSRARRSSGRDRVVLHQGSKAVKGTVQEGDRFGAALAVGDFDGDGHDDLAVGVPGEDVDGVEDAGAVVVLYGSGDGLTGEDSQFFHQDAPGVAASDEDGDGFGSALGAGHFVGDDRYDDLAIGREGDADGGALNILAGSEDGLSPGRERFVHEIPTR